MRRIFITSFLALLTILSFQTTFSLAQDCTADLKDEALNLQKPIEVIISTKADVEPYKLNLNDTLKLAMKNNLNIAIKRDKVNENKLQLDEVKSKKLLLFFKFANAEALEKSANYSLEASQANLKATSNNVLEEATIKYYNLLQTILARDIARDFLKLGELSLNQNQELLKEGKSTKFDVKQTEVFVANLKQKLLETEIAYMVSSVDLAQYLDQGGIVTKIIPEEVGNANNNNNVAESTDNTEDNNNFNVCFKTLNLIPDNILLNESLDYALNNRPELDELTHKMNSLQELKKATKSDEIKIRTIDSQINQIKSSYKLMQNTIKTTVTQALLKLIGSKSQIDVAKQKYSLSQSALNQAEISKKEGFATNKEVLDAQVNLAQSKNDYIKAIVSYNTAQITLLKELGIISIDVIIDNKPVELPKLSLDNKPAALSNPENTNIDSNSLENNQ